jgi:hypothetical protein
VTGWLDSWSGVGQVRGAVNELGYHVRVNQSPFGWWAEFRRAEVSPAPRWIGCGHDAAPWRAVQRAALETLKLEAVEQLASSARPTGLIARLGGPV